MYTKFTIITAVYNNVENIQHCIDSLNSQTYKNFEHIVIDGNSNDGTLEILHHNKKKITKLISEADKGICDAWNKGLKLANGDVVGFLHSDDFFASDKSLEKIANAFNRNPRLDAVYTDLEYVSKNNIFDTKRKWKSKHFKKNMINIGWMPPHPSLYVKKMHYEDNLFDLNFKIAGDYLSILKIFSKNNFQSEYIGFTSIKMRLGGVSNSLNNLLKKSAEDIHALRIMKYNLISSLIIVIFKNLQKITQIRLF